MFHLFSYSILSIENFVFYSVSNQFSAVFRTFNLKFSSSYYGSPEIEILIGYILHSYVKVTTII